MTAEHAALCRQMARLAGLGGFIVDLTDRRCIWCSEEVARIHGLPVDDCAQLFGSAHRIDQSVLAEDRETYRELWRAAVRDHQSYTVEYRIRDGRGETRWLAESADVIVDAAGGRARLVGSIQDMTARRQAEETLQRTNEILERRVSERTAELAAAKDAAEVAEREATAVNERFLAATEALRDGLAIYDADDRLVYHNTGYPDHAPPAFRANLRLGARFADMIEAAERDGGMYHPDMGPDFVRRRLDHRQADTEDREFQIADGRWVRVRESAIASGGRVLLTSDITDRKAAQETLEERERLWRSIADAIPLPIVIARIGQPEVLFVNAHASEVFGLRIGPQPAAINAAYVNPEDRRTLIRQLYQDGKVDNFEIQMRRADGTKMWGLMSASTIMVSDQMTMLATVTDISARRAAQIELEEREGQFRAIAESAPLGVVISRTDPSEILFASAVAEQTFGLRPGLKPEVIRSVYIRPDDRVRLIAGLRDAGRTDNLEVLMRRADGDPTWALVSSCLVTFGGAPAVLTAIADINRQKSMEQALRESEARFSAFVDHSPVGMYLKDIDGRYQMAHHDLCKASGRTMAEVIGRTASEIFPAEVAAQIDAFDQEVLSSGETTWHEEHVGNSDHYPWSMVIRFPIRDEHGNITHLGGCHLDISERRGMEQALRESEARLAAFMDNAPVGMYVKELDGRYLLANPEMSKVFARPADDMVGKTAADTWATHDAEAIAGRDLEVERSGKALVVEEHTPELDAYSWSLVIRFPIRDDRGEIGHIGGFHLDITGQKEAEQQLKASEQRFRALAEAHPVPLVIIHLNDARVMFASPPCEQLLGLPLAELVGTSSLKLFAEPSDRPGLIEQIRRDHALDGTEVRLRRPDGSEFWVALTSRLISFEGEDAMVTAILDLTERKRVEAELTRRRQMMSQNEKMSALGSLLAGVAHELNNPLSVVVGHASLLEELATDDKTRNRALKIRTAADRCARIVRTFLAMARSKPHQRGPVAINATIDEALEIVAYGLRTADIQVERRFDPDLPPVWGDGDQLHQVFTNLFVNAQQALQSVAPPRRITVTTRSDDESIWIDITDNGTGIADEIAHRVFEPFFTTKPQGVGTGVGLSVCHGIVSAHEGGIRLENAPEGGARFVVRLPRTKADAPAPTPAPDPSCRQPGRILVIDDEPDLGQLLIDILARDGHQVAVAGSGREALRHLAHAEVDLIISDLRMPDMDGPSLYRVLAATRPDLLPRMVFVTGDTLAADMTGFLSEIDARVIEKPLDPDVIGAKVQTFLAASAGVPARA